MNILTTKIEQLSHTIKYKFKDPILLRAALTHKSQKLIKYNLTHDTNNERLEFLGDAVLSLVSAEYFYKIKKKLKEGDLSRLRAEYVCRKFLSECAKRIKLAGYIISDKAMRRSGSNYSPSVLSDAMEAIIGAVFIDGGLESARSVIINIMGSPPSELKKVEKDFKTRLQELLQCQSLGCPEYILLSFTGPNHAPNFEIAVKINGQILGQAKGETKKIAAQNAAREVLMSLKINYI